MSERTAKSREIEAAIRIRLAAGFYGDVVSRGPVTATINHLIDSVDEFSVDIWCGRRYIRAYQGSLADVCDLVESYMYAPGLGD